LSAKTLALRAGERVRVRSEDEILETLDRDGRLDGLPFMPEMLQYCGREFRVYRTAHKACDTIRKTGARRMASAVHLEGLRCDGRYHGGCQAFCLIFWKEAWLERVPARGGLRIRGRFPRVRGNGRTAPSTAGCNRELLLAATTISDGADPQGPTYRCQATDLFEATAPLAWWDPRQYLRDLTSGNVRLVDMLSVFLLRNLRRLIEIGVGYRALMWTYNKIESLRGGPPYPYPISTRRKKTPKSTLGLRVGELVQVRSHAEIAETLDFRSQNRGMRFDPEMVRYCGGTYRVQQRVEKIINEQSGKMMRLPNDCIMLEGVICRAECSHRRLFCPRSITPYWREIWLKRVE
jgi:hypothetical protein